VRVRAYFKILGAVSWQSAFGRIIVNLAVWVSVWLSAVSPREPEWCSYITYQGGLNSSTQKLAVRSAKF
jgi:hypothetical protein